MCAVATPRGKERSSPTSVETPGRSIKVDFDLGDFFPRQIVPDFDGDIGRVAADLFENPSHVAVVHGQNCLETAQSRLDRVYLLGDDQNPEILVVDR